MESRDRQRKIAREKIAGWIVKVDVVDHRDDWTVKFRTIEAQRRCDLTRFTAIKEHGRGVGLVITKSAGLSNSLPKR